MRGDLRFIELGELTFRPRFGQGGGICRAPGGDHLCFAVLGGRLSAGEARPARQYDGKDGGGRHPPLPVTAVFDLGFPQVHRMVDGGHHLIHAGESGRDGHGGDVSQSGVDGGKIFIKCPAFGAPGQMLLQTGGLLLGERPVYGGADQVHIFIATGHGAHLLFRGGQTPAGTLC